MITKMDKAKMINDAVMSTALREAREEGIEAGTIEVAMNMLKENESLEKIAKYTTLTLEQIKEMKSNLE